jgi:hypothetical protein
VKWWFRDVSGFGSLPVQAIEGKIIVTLTGRRYLLGKAATHASLAAERDDAQRERRQMR